MNFPIPLDKRDLWNPGAWALPATTLSVASAAMLVLVIIGAFFWDDVHKYFTIPVDDESWLFGISAMVTVIIAGLIAMTVNRPNSILVKIWAILLFFISLSTILILWIESPPFWSKTWWLWHSFQHTYLLATIVATVILLPRIWKPNINSKFIQRVSPTTIFILIPVIIAFVSFLGLNAKKYHRDHVNNVLTKLKQHQENLTNFTTQNEEISLSQQQEKIVSLLNELPFKVHAVLDDATELKQQHEFQLVLSAIMTGIQQLSATKHLPTFSQIKQSPFKYNGETWSKNAAVAEHNQKILAYYQQLNQFLIGWRKEINKIKTKTGTKKIITAYQNARDSIKQQLENKADNWMDYSLRYQLPEIFEQQYSETDFVSYLINHPFLQYTKKEQEQQKSLSDMKDIVRGMITHSRLQTIAQRGNNCFQEKEKLLRCYAYLSNTTNTTIPLEFRIDFTTRYYNISIILPNENNLSFDTGKFLSTLRREARNKNTNFEEKVKLRRSPTTQKTTIGQINHYNNNSRIMRILITAK